MRAPKIESATITDLRSEMMIRVRELFYILLESILHYLLSSRCTLGPPSFVPVAQPLWSHLKNSHRKLSSHWESTSMTLKAVIQQRLDDE